MRARGHHFAARVNRPQASRSTPRWVERSGFRVSNRPTPGVFVWLRNEAAPVTILDQGAVAPLSISCQTLVGCHRAVHVSAVSAHRYRISPVSGSTHRWFGRWAVSSNTGPVASSIQSSWLPLFLYFDQRVSAKACLASARLMRARWPCSANSESRLPPLSSVSGFP
jgi:hypothetical protein